MEAKGPNISEVLCGFADPKELEHHVSETVNRGTDASIEDKDNLHMVNMSLPNVWFELQN